VFGFFKHHPTIVMMKIKPCEAQGRAIEFRLSGNGEVALANKSGIYKWMSTAFNGWSQ
jgi:hypothetical protein